MVSEGGYLLSIADLEGLSVAGRIDEVDVVKVKRGQPVRISGDAFPTWCSRGGERISLQSETNANVRVPTFGVTAVIERLPEAHLARLRLGMSANVTVVVRDEQAALLLPLDAVQGARGTNGCVCGARTGLRHGKCGWRWARRRCTRWRSLSASRPETK
ncbi:MAG: hypothetical protein OXE50_12425 [Chloroflexi bacterium]|nr:hypothetical protein [Chloroflexota bacterium]